MDDSVDIPTATTGEEAIPSYRPDASERRYDRQLRLWASSGQQSLEQAQVLLIGCDATGSQALKNLVLPGISSFTIMTDQLATAQDVATNFFLTAESVGRPIAGETVKYLCELNPAVTGKSICKDPALFSSIEDLRSYSLIIASNLTPAAENQLADILWQASIAGPDIPLILVRSSGFIGRLEVQAREHCVVDIHPDNKHTLRVGKPFPALEAYARELDLESMDSMEHSHVPWVVLLIKAALLWKDSHEGQGPRDLSDDGGRDEHQEFKTMLNGMRHKADEENFDEATAQAYQVWSESQISSELKALLDDNLNKDKCDSTSPSIHLLIDALRDYLKDHTLPPIAPTLPDMHSSTPSYLSLQKLYKDQFKQDLQEFKVKLVSVLARVELPEDSIPESDIESFARSTNAVTLVKGSSIASRRAIAGVLKTSIDDNFGLDDWPVTYGTPLHLAFLAADQVYPSLGRWPGTDEASYEADVEKVQSALTDLLQNAALPTEVHHCAQEVVRGGFSTPPTTAALLGGLAAQEAIKLITSQYAPLDNTCVVDLVHSTMAKFRL